MLALIVGGTVLFAILFAAIFAPLAFFKFIIIASCVLVFFSVALFLFVRALFSSEHKPRAPRRDPVHCDDETGLWYFWEENLAHRQGPFPNEAEARFALKTYIKHVLDAI